MMLRKMAMDNIARGTLSFTFLLKLEMANKKVMLTLEMANKKVKTPLSFLTTSTFTCVSHP